MTGRARGRAPLLWQLLRPETAILILLQALLCWLLLELPTPTVPAALGGLLLIVLWYAHAVAINDLSDVAADSINLPDATDRPLINNTASTRRVVVVTVALTIAIALLGYALSPWLLPVAMIMMGLNAMYSLPPLRLSGRGAAAQLLLPIGYVVFPAVVAWSIAGQPVVPVRGAIAVAGLYLLLCGRLFLKDIRDVEGDRRTGKRTFLVRHGLRPTLAASAAFLMLGVAVMIVTIMPPAQFVLILVGLTVGAYSIPLMIMLDDAKPGPRLLWVGLIGRAASMWTFCCTVSLATARWGGQMWQQELVTALAAIMFGISAYSYAEELRRER